MFYVSSLITLSIQILQRASGGPGPNDFAYAPLTPSSYTIHTRMDWIRGVGRGGPQGLAPPKFPVAPPKFLEVVCSKDYHFWELNVNIQRFPLYSGKIGLKTLKIGTNTPKPRKNFCPRPLSSDSPKRGLLGRVHIVIRPPSIKEQCGFRSFKRTQNLFF